MSLLLTSFNGQHPLFDDVIVFCGVYLPYVLVALFLGLVVFASYARREKVEIALVAFCSGLVARYGVTAAIRSVYERTRPFVDLPVHPLIAESSWSFPSEHALFFFGLATAVYLYERRWGWVFYLGALIVSVARVVAGIHYVSDIAAGALLGVLVAVGVNRVVEAALARV